MGLKRRSVLVGVALLLALELALAAAGCGGSGGGSGPDIPMAYTYRAGDTWVQEVTTTVEGTAEAPGQEAAATTADARMRMTTVVKSVTADGAASITVKLETLETTIDGQLQDPTAEEPQEVTMTVDKAGRVLATDSAAGTEAASSLLESGNYFGSHQLAIQFSSMIYPADGTAKVGEEWTTESSDPLSGLDQQVTVTTKAKLISVSTENGRQVATIEYTTSVPMDAELDLGALFSAMMGGSGGPGDFAFKMTVKGAMEFSGTGKFDTATGQTVSSTGSGNVDLKMEITEAPVVFVPKDQRGPFATAMAIAMTVAEVE